MTKATYKRNHLIGHSFRVRANDGRAKVTDESSHETPKPASSDTPSQIVPPTRDQFFKHINLWRYSHSIYYIMFLNKNYLCMLNDCYEPGSIFNIFMTY